MRHDWQCSSAARALPEPPAGSSNEEEDDQADSLEQAARSVSRLTSCNSTSLLVVGTCILARTLSWSQI